MGCGASAPAAAAPRFSDVAPEAEDDEPPALWRRARHIDLAAEPAAWLRTFDLLPPMSDPVVEQLEQLGAKSTADIQLATPEELASMRRALELPIPKRKFDQAVKALQAAVKRAATGARLNSDVTPPPDSPSTQRDDDSEATDELQVRAAEWREHMRRPGVDLGDGAASDAEDAEAAEDEQQWRQSVGLPPHSPQLLNAWPYGAPRLPALGGGLPMLPAMQLQNTLPFMQLWPSLLNAQQMPQWPAPNPDFAEGMAGMGINGQQRPHSAAAVEGRSAARALRRRQDRETKQAKLRTKKKAGVVSRPWSANAVPSPTPADASSGTVDSSVVMGARSPHRSPTKQRRPRTAEAHR